MKAMAALVVLLGNLYLFSGKEGFAYGRESYLPSSSCPIDFWYVEGFRPSCLESDLATECCTSLFNILGIGIALYLRSSGFFELPNNASFASCLLSYRSSLLSNSLLSPASFDSCKPSLRPLDFVQNPRLCSGILTARDWQHKVGPTNMDSSCAGDLSDLAVCNVCVRDLVSAIQKASGLSQYRSGCTYFAVLYAAGVVNRFGPANSVTAACLVGVRAVENSPNAHRLAGYVAMGATIVLVGGTFFAIFLWLWYLRRRQLYHRNFIERNHKLLSGSLHPNVGAIWYRIEDIRAATSNFAENKVIGVGGFASVYKGIMPDGSQVAVKRIKNCTSEGDAEFVNEVAVINSVRHRNLVVLRGCCVDSNSNLGNLRLLVYDLMPNGSLEDYLFSGKKPILRWPERMKIALGAAKGLAYLHYGVQPAIIHRDIKAQNILLDENLNARVADFGLARVTPEGMSHISTRVAGTQGYLAPEYALYGQLTEKSDVYSFGVLLLVIMSGRQALDARGTHPLITDWAWVIVKKGDTSKILDERIRNDGPAVLMEKFVLVGILCAHLLVAFRPTMAQALKMLEGDAEISEIPDRPLPLIYDSLESSEEVCSSSSLPIEVAPIPPASEMLSGDGETPHGSLTHTSIQSSEDISSFSSRPSYTLYSAEDLCR